MVPEATTGTGGTAGQAGASGLPGLSLLAGGLGGPGNIDGIGAAARFWSPVGVASDGAGNLYVTSAGGGGIRKIVIATGAVTTIVDATGTSVLTYPHGITSDGAGNLYVTDNFTIRKVVIATGAVTTIAGAAGQLGSADGTGANALFIGPTGIVADGAGNLYVSDTSQSDDPQAARSSARSSSPPGPSPRWRTNRVGITTQAPSRSMAQAISTSPTTAPS